MQSKRATKEAGTGIYCIAIAMKATTQEIPDISLKCLAGAERASVIPVPLASSVICVVTHLQEQTSTRPS
jgi:hypothetical protein